ncbi:MAG: hypothetical protein QXV73_05140 [Candidatus Micrarchaeia archaeon]
MNSDLNGDAKGIKTVTTVDMRHNDKTNLWDVKIHVTFSVTKDLVQWENLEFESIASNRDPGIAYKKALDEILNTTFDGDEKAGIIL